MACQASCIALELRRDLTPIFQPVTAAIEIRKDRKQRHQLVCTVDARFREILPPDLAIDASGLTFGIAVQKTKALNERNGFPTAASLQSVKTQSCSIVEDIAQIQIVMNERIRNGEKFQLAERVAEDLSQLQNTMAAQRSNLRRGLPRHHIDQKCDHVIEMMPQDRYALINCPGSQRSIDGVDCSDLKRCKTPMAWIKTASAGGVNNGSPASSVNQAFQSFLIATSLGRNCGYRPERQEVIDSSCMFGTPVDFNQ